MAKGGTADRINIRPGVTILSVLRHLNYRPWFAMAEFADNALQSFLIHKENLKRLEDNTFKLRVGIELDSSGEGSITIRDNAAGIHESDYARAFRPAEVPTDRTGLSEFGMGMKSAACWFARNWMVRTSALGETVERTVSFDIATIVQDRLEELAVSSRPIAANIHFTEIVLSGLHKPPQGRTVSKIKEHLASIYRVFIRDGILEITFDGEPLKYEEPAILRAPLYNAPTGPPWVWKKEIDFDFGQGQRARGFAALRETASTSGAGFALFRRNRLIQGSVDEGYRPETIFGKSNSYRYQRLFGELHLEGFEVSHTKDGFRWEEHEEPFLELLREHLNSDPLPLLTQAEEHRVRPQRGDFAAGAQIATQRTAEVIERDVPAVLAQQIDMGPEQQGPPAILPHAEAFASTRLIDIELHGQPWQILLELSTDPAIGDWLSVSDRPSQSDPRGNRIIRCIGVRLSLAHPFMDRFCGTEPTRIEVLLRVAAAIGLAETAARDSGVLMVGTIRRNINELLRNALSNP